MSDYLHQYPDHSLLGSRPQEAIRECSFVSVFVVCDTGQETLQKVDCTTLENGG